MNYTQSVYVNTPIRAYESAAGAAHEIPPGRGAKAALRAAWLWRTRQSSNLSPLYTVQRTETELVKGRMNLCSSTVAVAAPKSCTQAVAMRWQRVSSSTVGSA